MTVPNDRIADPVMFAALNDREREILAAHLTSGWKKQQILYNDRPAAGALPDPCRSCGQYHHTGDGPDALFWDTADHLRDLHICWQWWHEGAARQARAAAEAAALRAVTA